MKWQKISLRPEWQNLWMAPKSLDILANMRTLPNKTFILNKSLSPLSDGDWRAHSSRRQSCNHASASLAPSPRQRPLTWQLPLRVKAKVQQLQQLTGETISQKYSTACVKSLFAQTFGESFYFFNRKVRQKALKPWAKFFSCNCSVRNDFLSKFSFKLLLL